MRASAPLVFGLVLLGLPATALAQGIDLSAGGDADASTSPTDAADDEPVDHAPDDLDAGAGGDMDADGGDGDGDGDGDDGGGLRDGDLPYDHVDRPMTLPEFYLAPSLGFSNYHFDVRGFSANAIVIGAGARFGITDDFEVEATPLSLQFGDVDEGYSFFGAGATYRFLEGEFEMGGRLRFAINTQPDVFINPSLPMRLHAGDIVRLDTGVNFTLVLPDGGDATPSLSGLGGVTRGVFGGGAGFGIEPGVPLNVDFQIVREFWLGLGTGFGAGDMGEFGDTIFVPLGFRAGGTIPGGNDEPLVDIDGGFSFPLFVTSVPGIDPIGTEFWQFGVTGTVFLPL